MIANNTTQKQTDKQETTHIALEHNNIPQTNKTQQQTHTPLKKQNTTGNTSNME